MITDVFRSPAQRRQAEQFADLLEGRLTASGHELESLLTLAASLRAPEVAPPSDFSSALRARLVQETSQHLPATRVPSRRSGEAQESRSHRIRQTVAALTAVAIVGGAGAAAASTRALPGDSLYGLKRGLEAAQLSLAGSEMARGRELLEQADARLGEAETMAASGQAADADSRARIGQALADMDTAVRDGSTVLTDVYRQTGDTAALAMLDRFVIEQQRRLDALLDRLAGIDPALRDAADATVELLAALHAHVAAVTPTAAGVNNSAGAARDPRPLGDGWEVSRAADNLVSTQGLVGVTGPSSSSASGNPQGSSNPGAGLVADASEAGSSATALIGTPDPTVAGTGAAPAPAPTAVPAPPVITPPTTVPTVAVPQVDVEAPCVPVAPLTTC
ncbi:MAG: DUF5667 domain-containing protein [Sporichthyaceae bacterium]